MEPHHFHRSTPFSPFVYKLARTAALGDSDAMPFWGNKKSQRLVCMQAHFAYFACCGCIQVAYWIIVNLLYSGSPQLGGIYIMPGSIVIMPSCRCGFLFTKSLSAEHECRTCILRQEQWVSSEHRGIVSMWPITSELKGEHP